MPWRHEGKKFENVSRKLFPKTPWGSMGIKAFDFDNDGDLDIFITDMHSDMSNDEKPSREKQKADMQWPESFLQTDGASVFGNAFYHNRGENGFVEISQMVNAENYWPWGLSVDDLNADGFDDAFVTSSMNFPFRYGVNSLLLNQHGLIFRDSEFVLGVEPRADGLVAPWFELDLTGSDAGSSVVGLIRNTSPELGKLPERAVVWSALGSRSSVLFDLENDGDLDIVTNEMNYYPMVLVSNLSEQAPRFNYLKVKLIGTKSNRSGLGARVTIVVDGNRRMKVKDGQSGYLSHSDLPLYFGLNQSDTVSRIEVKWPSGVEQVVEGPIESNQLLEIREQP